jgi:hypothetical protein
VTITSSLKRFRPSGWTTATSRPARYFNPAERRQPEGVEGTGHTGPCTL